MDERRIVEILDMHFSSIYNYVYFHLLNQAATEAMVSQIFNKRITMDAAYGREIEELILYKLAHKALCEKKNQGNTDEQEHSHDKTLSAIHMLLSGLTWEERGLLFLLYQDITSRECAEIFNITETDFLRRKATLLEKLEGISNE